MRHWIRQFRGFLISSGLCAGAFCVPHEGVRTVAAGVFLFLVPSFFLLTCVDQVRRANERKGHGEALSRVETVALLLFRGLIGLFGITTVLIGAAVCAWVLYQSHWGGLPVLISLFLGAIVLRRVFWARLAVSFGWDLVRVAFGRESTESKGEEQEGPWTRPKVFIGSLRLEPHGAVPVVMPGSREEPHPDAQRLAGELAARYPTLRPEIETRLFAHLRHLHEREPGERPGAAPPRLLAPSEVWSCVSLDHVRIGPEDGSAPIEIAFVPAWDLEGELFLRIHDWRRMELESSDRLQGCEAPG